MSDTQQPDAEQPMPLAAFAVTLRPRAVGSRTMAPRRGPAQTVPVMAPGSPDEIWLGWLRAKHGAEKHTKTGWQKLIDDYAAAPAHAADPNYRP